MFLVGSMTSPPTFTSLAIGAATTMPSPLQLQKAPTLQSSSSSLSPLQRRSFWRSELRETELNSLQMNNPFPASERQVNFGNIR